MKQRWSTELLSSLDKECVEYFRKRSVFDLILRGFREKYFSYGSFAGTVTVRNLSDEEIEDLEGFFQRNYHGQKSVSISASRFEKALSDSRFEDISPKKLLEMYFYEEMTGKKEKKLEEEKQWQMTFQKLQKEYNGTPVEILFGELKTVYDSSVHPEILSLIKKRYKENGNSLTALEKDLRMAAKIINFFPYRTDSQEYLAVFSSMLTGNPHAFDDRTRDGQFLYALIQWEEEKRGIKIEKSDLFPTLHRQKQYLAVGILRDDISNYAIISGIHVWKSNGEIHAGMEGFLQERDMVQVPLSVIAKWQKVTCPRQTIYIVENPSVYSMMCRKWKGEKACMCMNGQPRLSSILILDLLAKSGVTVYYAGDFDPEGLLIAQKLKKYYQGDFKYWQMSEQIYEKSRSKKCISETRLKMLDRITDPELIETAEAMKKNRMAGYQENLFT